MLPGILLAIGLSIVDQKMKDADNPQAPDYPLISRDAVRPFRFHDSRVRKEIT